MGLPAAVSTTTLSSVHRLESLYLHLLCVKALQDAVCTFVVTTFLHMQVLSRDIRSLHQRRGPESGHSVHLMGIRLDYRIAHGGVQLVSATVSADVEDSASPTVSV